MPPDTIQCTSIRLLVKSTHVCSMKGKLESCETGWFGVFGSRVCWTERVRLRDKKRESQSSSTGWFTYNKTTQIEGDNRNSCYTDAEGVLFFSETNPKIYVNPVVHNRKIDQVQLVFARFLPTVWESQRHCREASWLAASERGHKHLVQPEMLGPPPS